MGGVGGGGDGVVGRSVFNGGGEEGGCAGGSGGTSGAGGGCGGLEFCLEEERVGGVFQEVPGC